MKSNLFLEQLKLDGFVATKIKDITLEKGGQRYIDTFDHYYIFIVFDGATFSVEQKDYNVNEPSIIFLSPLKTIIWNELLNQNNSYALAFSSSLYERSA